MAEQYHACQTFTYTDEVGTVTAYNGVTNEKGMALQGSGGYT